MGNCVSANSSTKEIVQAPKSIRVVQAAQGRVVDVEVQQSPAATMMMKVGELMLELPPAHFLAQLHQADFLNAASPTGKRASPLGADADATPGAVYVLLPMARLHTRINPQELLSFSKLLQLHDQKLLAACKAAAAPKVQARGLFNTAGARVAPLGEEEDKLDADLLQYSGATNEQACPLQQESMSSPDSSSLLITSWSCHGQVQGFKPIKPWAPKLQTIQES